jgi:hypothetical protein
MCENNFLLTTGNHRPPPFPFYQACQFNLDINAHLFSGVLINKVITCINKDSISVFFFQKQLTFHGNYFFPTKANSRLVCISLCVSVFMPLCIFGSQLEKWMDAM